MSTNQDAQSPNPGDVRAYLAREAQTPKGWLRRDPKTTHPTITRLVRCAQAAGITYDDDTNEYVAGRLGIAETLRDQLGHETYVAKGIISDDSARAKRDAMLAEGFTPMIEADLRDGDRYLVRFGTTYVGREVPDYTSAQRYRIKRTPTGVYLMPHGSRTRGYRVPSDALAKPDDARKG